MNTIWFSTPVVVFFRRLINAVSTVSIISRQYPYPLQTAPAPQGREDADKNTIWGALRLMAWSSWLEGAPWKLALAEEGYRASQPAAPNPEYPSRSPRHIKRRDGSTDTIHKLMNNPVLYDPVRAPRYPIALCHGLYGFDVRGPAAFPWLQTHYWSNVLGILRRTVGAEVIVTSVPSTGSIESRSESMDKSLRQRAQGRAINFVAHSMGGLDCRHLITHIKPKEYTPLSLTSIATPHRGSPFMDWCQSNIGLGKLTNTDDGSSKQIAAEMKEAYDSTLKDEANKTSPHSASLSLSSLPSSFTTLLLSLLDSPAYANLTSSYLTSVFNPRTPDDPSVKYFSVAGRVSSMSVWHPLWLPKMVLDRYEEKQREKGLELDEWGNDGLVTIDSARWGEFLGVMEGCDHWTIRGARGIEVDLPAVSVPGLRIGLSAGGSAGGADDESRTNGDGWGLTDWSKFVRAWKKEEKDGKMGTKRAEEGAGARPARADGEPADEVVKSSTDKVSAVFDWIVEQVPATRSLPLPSLLSSTSEPDTSRKQEERNELASKSDLERFYVALCRKLYDEGL